jgi:segregation and condensation protein A
MTLIGKAKRKLPPPMSAFSAIVTRRVVSVTSRIVFILKKLYKNNEAEYLSFYQTGDRSELVATFLAMLELVKAKRIMVSETGEYIYSNKKTAEKNNGH